MTSRIRTVPAAGMLAGANPIMSIGAAVLVIVFVLFTVVDPEYAGGLYSAAKGLVASNLAWYYIALMSFFLFFAVWLSFSRFGSLVTGSK